MMALPIFPEGGLASSVITTVWVGVWVLCFFNLRFGWVLSGLVVPGYLVPLLLVKPVAALVIVIEAIITYLIVWLFSEKAGRGYWPSLFGRDRFMGLILASIAVRLTLDGYALPHLAGWLETNWNRNIDWQSDLQSFGLVIISLMANQFWKPGLARGLVSLVVVTFITWFIVRYGLMEFTNFRMSGVTYLYEGLASSVLASPKAYIILVITALYASHMNVRFGWDFSGILIPALIALQWYQPTKILTSFAEAVVIYFIARQLLRTPWLANATIEGANKVLLFFNISFVLKLIVGHALVWLAWEVKTTDFYGFGYLLSTLLAMKAHDKDIFPRLMRSTLQVSFVGAALGNLVGLALAFVLPASAANAGNSAGPDTPQSREDALMVTATGDAYWRNATRDGTGLSQQAVGTLDDAVELMAAQLPAVQIGATAASGGWRIETLGPARSALIRDDGAGSDLLLFNGTARRNILVRLDNAAAAPGIAMVARALAKRLDARWLLISAPPGPGNTGVPAADAVAAAVKAPQIVVTLATVDARPSLTLSGGSATAVDINLLRQLWPELTVGFALQDANVQQAERAVLALPAAALMRTFEKSTPASAAAVAECQAPPAPRGPPRLRERDELLFLRFEVVEPLLDTLERGGNPVEAGQAASMLGLTLTPCALGQAGGWMLSSLEPVDGAYLFATQGSPEVLVESALRQERRGSVASTPETAANLSNAGLALFRQSQAQILALAARELEYDGSQATVFGVVTQTAIARLGDQPGLVIQVRPRPIYSSPAIPAGKTILLPDRGSISPAEQARYEAMARAAGYDPIVATRAPQFAGYEAFPHAALRFLNQSFGKHYLIVYPPAEQR